MQFADWQHGRTLRYSEPDLTLWVSGRGEREMFAQRSPRRDPGPCAGLDREVPGQARDGDA